MLTAQFMSAAKSLHKEIQLLPNVDFSDPDTVITLPFPSPLCPPLGRFTIKKGIVDTFQYMGRDIFQHILKEVEDTSFQTGRHDLYLYGPSGMGKSHLVAALVCHLIKNGKRVVYIPDCARLLEDHEAYIQEALLFAFYDDADSVNAIMHSRAMHHLLLFVRNQPVRSLYIIVDQRNALEINEHGTDMRAASKVTIWDNIDKLRKSQNYIFSASANANSVYFRDKKQINIRTINLGSGLSEVCPYLFNVLISCSPD